MNAPAITVLMPVHNGAAYLKESVDSILAQTYTDFELLVIDDGSTDVSPSILSACNDRRLRVERFNTKRGIVAALNRGLALAQGAYIARMDADDIAEPGRLADQFAFMEANPDVGALGTDITPIGEIVSQSWIRYFDAENLRISLLFENPLCHPTVILRRSALASAGGAYPDNSPHAEEYALWIRLSAHAKLVNLPQPLLRYRMHAGQISRQKSVVQSHSIDRLVGAQLDALGLPAGARDLRLHHTLANGFFPAFGLSQALRKWCDSLITANARARLYPADILFAQLEARRASALARHDTQLRAMPFPRRLQWRVTSSISLLGRADPR